VLALPALAAVLAPMVAPGAAALPTPAADGGNTSEAALLIVTAPLANGRVMPPGVRLDVNALVDRQPRNLGDALRGLPGVSVRPNSRGDSVPRIRGGEERQTQVFLDGAPLSVPWDGRISLDLLPAGLAGSITVRKGAVPIEYGTNAVAGVVDITSRRGGRDGEGPGVAGIGQVGTFGTVNVGGVVTAPLGGVEVTVAASHISQDAARVADPAALPFSQADSRRRTNSDADSTSLFAAIGGELGRDIDWRASVLHFAAARGVAPESDRDPAISAPRFWRYPAIGFTQASVALGVRLGAASQLRVTGWQQWFDQTIDAYRSVDFAALRGRETNDDTTTGGRVTLTNPLGPLTLRWSGTAQSSTHVQTDTAFPPGVTGPELTYRQNLFSLGVEADAPLSTRTRLTGGIGYDIAANPLTGDKPAQPRAGNFAFSAGVHHRFDPHWGLTITGGRRTRFASARELFGEALGRFLPNPDLAPETVWLADAELTWRDLAGATVTLNPFFARTLDGISQRIVRVGNVSLRQRYNVAGATSYGIDALALVPIGADVSLQFGGTLLSANADAGTTAFRRQVQRPAHELTAAIDWAPARAVDMRAEIRRIGPAVDLAPDGSEARLPAATEINLRIAVPVVRLARGPQLSLTAAADNITDALIVPQLGLPLPGRTLRIGFRVD
jgi:iron complex outermembrane recepter protein